MSTMPFWPAANWPQLTVIPMPIIGCSTCSSLPDRAMPVRPCEDCTTGVKSARGLAHSKTWRTFYDFMVMVAAISLASIVALRAAPVGLENATPVLHQTRIKPDYVGVMIPPNIAPMNFTVQETGSGFFVRLHSSSGQAIEISSDSPRIQIPEKAWHKLLRENRGNRLDVEIY